MCFFWAWPGNNRMRNSVHLCSSVIHLHIRSLMRQNMGTDDKHWEKSKTSWITGGKTMRKNRSEKWNDRVNTSTECLSMTLNELIRMSVSYADHSVPWCLHLNCDRENVKGSGRLIWKKLMQIQMKYLIITIWSLSMLISNCSS